MADNQTYNHYTKMAWIIYSALAVTLACVLVLFVAQDTEEQFFYGIMTIAAAYVFRPTERFMSKQILKYTGVSKPEESTEKNPDQS